LTYNWKQNVNYKEILETNQRLQQAQQAGQVIEKRHKIQTLNLKYHNYLTAILKILLGMAGFSMVVFIFILLYIRGSGEKCRR